jgi:fructosamine-3-kinase
MNLPEDVRHAVDAALASRAGPDPIAAAVPVAGGCINHGARVETAAGAAYFLKWNAAAPDGMFAAEADGLLALRRAGPLTVPAPLAWGGGDGSPAWLLMEYIERGRGGPDSDARLGRALATLHDGGRGGGGTGGGGASIPDDDFAGFGWHRDNWIGSLPQANEPDESWGAFWRDRRIAPQLALARGAGHLTENLFDRVVDVIPRALEDVTKPSLLHGDLWSGNVFLTPAGEPVLVDPAVYRGHGEVDLAMSELFGGFGPDFHAAYAEARGLGDAYRSYRKALYQLYYLVVHVNLFGGSYVEGSRRAAERVVGEVA